MFSAENLNFSVNRKKLLDQVSLSIAPGTVTALVGPNGAGKSTLLKLFSRELVPDSGKLTINRMPLYTLAPEQAARLRAILPQKSDLVFDFRVFDVVEMGRLPHRRTVSGEVNREIIERSMKYADVYHLRKRIYTSLSGGEQQRVHLARVLSQIGDEQFDQPRYLFLDEPTSALDPEHQHTLLNLVRDFSRSRNVGVLLVVHDLNLASMYADTVAVMEQGVIRYCAEPFDAMAGSHVEAVFKVQADIRINPFKNCPLVVTRQKAPSNLQNQFKP